MQHNNTPTSGGHWIQRMQQITSDSSFQPMFPALDPTQIGYQVYVQAQHVQHFDLNNGTSLRTLNVQAVEDMVSWYISE